MVKPDKLIKSSRKTISLQVTETGEVVVRVPNKLSQKELEAFLLKHDKWIIKNVKLAQAKHQETAYASFKHGSYLYFFGEKLYIEVIPLKSKAIEVTDKIYINQQYEKSAKKIILAWYKREAKKYAERRIKQICHEQSLKVTNIKISNAKTRWGSCSGKNSINISWRLVMAPASVFDYVIYHELAHIRHKNHSKSFWQEVESFDKHYKISEKWLRDYGHLLSAIN